MVRSAGLVIVIFFFPLTSTHWIFCIYRHIYEHLKEQEVESIDLTNATPEELQFHFFKYGIMVEFHIYCIYAGIIQVYSYKY